MKTKFEINHKAFARISVIVAIVSTFTIFWGWDSRSFGILFTAALTLLLSLIAIFAYLQWLEDIHKHNPYD